MDDGWDDPVDRAAEVAKAILRSWTRIHAEYEEGFVAVMTEAIADAMLLEWEQWVEAVRQIGETYIDDSPGFRDDVLKDLSTADRRMAQETWDTANSTFDQLFVRRWNGPILAHVMKQLNDRRHALKAAFAAEVRKKVEPPPAPPKKKPKLRRKSRRSE